MVPPLVEVLPEKRKNKNINVLPKQVLAKIFDYLFLKSEHGNAAKASKDWQKIIEDYLGIALLIGAGGGQYFLNYPKVPLDRQLIMSAYTWTSRSLVSAGKKENTEDALNKKFPRLKNSELLKKLVLMGNVDRTCFLELTDLLKNLAGLYLHVTVFENNIFSLNDKLELPTLKYLVLDDTAAILTAEEFNVNDIFDSATVFLKTGYFHSLERLGIEFPLFEAKEASFTSAIVEFMEKHARSLKALTVHQKYEIRLKEEDDEGSDRDSDDNDNDSVNIKMLSRNAQKLKNVKLEEICIALFDSQESSPLWKNFLSHQENLAKLFYINYQIPFPGSLVQKNISTLKVLVVNIKTSVDFTHLMGDKCQIKTLVIVGENSSEPEIDIPNARNLSLLPNSVITLKLCGVTAFSKDIEAVALRKPNLKELVLEDAGTKYQLGMTLETYGYLLDKKQLQRFTIKNSFNKASFSDFSRIPKNVEGLSTVPHSKKGLTVKGLLDESIGRYTLNGYQDVNTDLEGEGNDVFNLLSGIVDTAIEGDGSEDRESRSSSSGSRSGTSQGDTDDSGQSHSRHGTDDSDNSHSSSDSGRVEDDSESDTEEFFEDEEPSNDGD